MTLRVVHEAGPWRIEMAEGAGDTLVLAFASIGHDLTRMPSPEFVGVATAGGRRALFVMDQARSWGTGAGFAKVLRAGLTAAGPAGPSRRAALRTQATSCPPRLSSRMSTSRRN